MAKFTPTSDEIVRLFRNSMAYEIMYAFGVPDHDDTDYCMWEMMNYARLGHARLLREFFDPRDGVRYKDTAVCTDYDFPLQKIILPPADDDRVNKDLLHLTYARLRHSPESKRWTNSLLVALLKPVIGFMEHVRGRSELFESPEQSDLWERVMAILKAGRELRIRTTQDAANRQIVYVEAGVELSGGLPRLTPLRPAPGQTA